MYSEHRILPNRLSNTPNLKIDSCKYMLNYKYNMRRLNCKVWLKIQNVQIAHNYQEI